METAFLIFLFCIILCRVTGKLDNSFKYEKREDEYKSIMNEWYSDYGDKGYEDVVNLEFEEEQQKIAAVNSAGIPQVPKKSLKEKLENFQKFVNEKWYVFIPFAFFAGVLAVVLISYYWLRCCFIVCCCPCLSCIWWCIRRRLIDQINKYAPGVDIDPETKELILGIPSDEELEAFRNVLRILKPDEGAAGA